MTAPTLTEFLLARYAEDEAAARDALEQGSEPEPEPWLAVGWPSSEHPGPVVLVGPERFLAECEAKRRIIDAAEDLHSRRFILEALALPYANHPDYDEAWRP